MTWSKESKSQTERSLRQVKPYFSREQLLADRESGVAVQLPVKLEFSGEVRLIIKRSNRRSLMCQNDLRTSNALLAKFSI
ncbi:MAG: hypothetical protein ACI8W1_000236 [Candidatus Azotimanducaceae bacterium]|jgi:hypothetical protein